MRPRGEAPLGAGLLCLLIFYRCCLALPGSGESTTPATGPSSTAPGLPMALGTAQTGGGGDACGCTIDTLPHPRIVLLGPTGVGKSTFGNRLFGLKKNNTLLYNTTEALCNQNGERPFKFGVGHRTGSHTNETSWMVGHYLGDPANPCITIIDTPGTGDTEGNDCDHGIALAKGIKAVGSINAFILLFRGSSPRFSKHLQDQIKLYQNIFGAEMFANVISEFTYWSHDHRSRTMRKEDRQGLTEDIMHDAWNKEYGVKFRVPRVIPTVFIDPVYKEKYAMPRETEINKENTDKLWKLLTTFKTFHCDKRCKAPSGFFSGQPWLFDEDAVQKKRLNDRTVITWQIWFAGCDGSGTKSYTLSHQPLGGAETVLYENVVQEDDNEVTNDTRLLKSMKVVDEPSEKFKTIRLSIESVEDQHFGSYYITNDKGESNRGELKKIVDGEWEDWGPYGNCDKTCITGNMRPGIMRRRRACKPPQNGGQPCHGEKTASRNCAHPPGDDGEVFRQCPVNAKWSSWPSDWGVCNGNCLREGHPAPKKSRTRVCQPEQYGGRDCTFLEDQTRRSNQPLYTEKQDCSLLPNCPKRASLGPWSEWSTCSQTCYPEGEAIPQTSRQRSCNEATLSSDLMLNEDVATCKDLGGDMRYKNCDITKCPVKARWQQWGHWSNCPSTCGNEGTQHRQRSFIPGRYGAEDTEPEADHDGGRTLTKPCRGGDCPVAATWTWSKWSPCDIECYKSLDSYRGEQTKTPECQEGSPRHDFQNCDYPSGGFQQTAKICTDIGQCPVLSSILAHVSTDSFSGTGGSVYLMLKNYGTLEECETGILDGDGFSWESGDIETYSNKEEELNSCNMFYPEAGKLMFSIKLINGNDLKLTSLKIGFGDENYVWHGPSWFEALNIVENPNQWLKMNREN